MAAKVLRGLAAELVGGAARSAELKEHRSQQRVGVVLPAAEAVEGMVMEATSSRQIAAAGMAPGGVSR